MEQIGRYRVVGELGRGAMGIVFKAQDPAIGRMIAIKSIRLGELTDESERARLRERLFREAQSAGILSHPGIVTIYDIAEEGNMAYIFMELVNGPPLEKLLKSERPPDKETLLSLLRQTAAALDYAHKKGIVHRDVKPANIMVHEDGTAKVTDFGVAKIVSQQLTRAGTIMGTPSYMSPEQVQGDAVSGRSDQFSLAVIAYEILTGEKPFQAEYLPTLLFKIVGEDPVSPHRLNPTLPPEVEPVIRRALAKVSEERYETCSDFVAALAEACADSLWVPLPRGASNNMPTVDSADLLISPTADLLGETPALAIAGVDGSLLANGDFDATVADVSAPGEAKTTENETTSDPTTTNPTWTPRQRAEVPTGLGARNIMLGVLAGIVVIGAVVYVTRDSRSPDVAGTSASQSVAPPASVAPGEQGGRPADATQAASATTPAIAPGAPISSNADSGSPKPKAVTSGTPATPEIPSQIAFHLTTTPAGAEATIDGSAELRCMSPCALNLPSGQHSIVVRHDGYRDVQRAFNLPDETELILTMAARTGILSLVSTPPGLGIFVDGQEQPRKTPASLSLTVGSHRVQIVKGTDKQDFTVDIRDGVFTERSVEWGN